ncbi:hypothetical protein [Amycolatopsis saalfeldensis]|uniref:hypothetical protein n=1 Tax=Amycolatopsis saalfeldensis TaxID=394193 RepID=UPI0011604B66|nr:hypothetical protein [Amycolatopsis saalfeldensis]
MSLKNEGEAHDRPAHAELAASPVADRDVRHHEHDREPEPGEQGQHRRPTPLRHPLTPLRAHRRGEDIDDAQ